MPFLKRVELEVEYVTNWSLTKGMRDLYEWQLLNFVVRNKCFFLRSQCYGKMSRDFIAQPASPRETMKPPLRSNIRCGGCRKDNRGETASVSPESHPPQFVCDFAINGRFLSQSVEPAAWRRHFISLARSASLRTELKERGVERVKRFSCKESSRAYLELNGRRG